MLQVLIDAEFDPAPLHTKYINDDTGAPAGDDPAVLLKIALLAYSRGIISRRTL